MSRSAGTWIRVALVCACAQTACSSDAVSPTLGFDEPLRARPSGSGSTPQRAQFHGGTPHVVADGPTTTLESSGDLVLPPGKVGKRFEGFASATAVSIGVRFRDYGSGYWVIPTGAIDRTQAEAVVAWRAEVDVGYGLPAGLTKLLAYAIDDAGRSGEPAETTVCLAPPIPDNAASCDPALRPPAVVLSLSWDANVDLDLRLVTPDGKVVGAGRPTTASLADGGISTAELADPSTGRLQFDSTRGCAVDGRRRENIVWQGRPVAGTYLAYANLFDACDLGSVRFDLDLYVAQPSAPGELTPQVKTHLGSGVLLALDANGGNGAGLFMKEIVLQ